MLPILLFQMKRIIFCLVVLASWYASSVTSARILALFPYIGKSHFDVFEPFVKELATRGHHVVVLSHFPQKQPLPNYTDVSLVGSITTDATDRIDLQNISGIMLLKSLVKEISTFLESCDQMLSFDKVQELLNSEVNFDLIITETFLTDCFLPFVHKFKAPHVAISSCVMFPWSNDRMGNPDNPSYIPTHGMWFSDKMDFSERFLNVIANVGLKFIFHAIEGIVTQKYARKHFGDDVPLLSNIARNTSLLLVNSHFSLNRPRPYVPGIVEVGGLHIKPRKKLPKVQLMCDSSESVGNVVGLSWLVNHGRIFVNGELGAASYKEIICFKMLSYRKVNKIIDTLRHDYLLWLGLELSTSRILVIYR
jgi:glucuronosyltransferase